MGNLVWTAILYGSTLGIAYIIYRLFQVDRLADNKQRTNDLVNRTQGNGPAIQPARPVKMAPPAHAWQKRPAPPGLKITPR